ncbi:Nramp family divalent metal transporter [Streptomyces sp. GZWMJZ-114]|uniref:Nramp family divalent metal transporter n=1 Tax=Streptomyces sp. GZWMJZ-114 TaxID=2494734 RepID=UPI001013A095|nr:Nramp family divalent metal transporter [Streptomyces sp. GZWMJZ-114]
MAKQKPLEDAAASATLSSVLSRGRIRGRLALLGPAFVASVAYVDPGNFATNFQAGGAYGYLLVWVVVMANLVAILVQYLTSKLGLRTGKSLPEICRDQYRPRWNALLWIQAEVVAMATDLAEFTGAAVGLNMVFGIELLPAGLVTGVIALGILALEKRGYRRFELVIIVLLAFVSFGFLADFFAVGRQSYGDILNGLIPHFEGGGTINLAVGIIGATVMPHVVYLHSALQSRRIRPADDLERQVLLRFDRWDCVLGLGLAGLVNLSMLCIAAALFHRPGLTGINDLGQIHQHLFSLVGKEAALAFGIALIASGLASASVGTYAGQIVMAGFMGWRIPLILRRMLTMIPSLLVLGFSVNPTTALIFSQIVLSFGIPFALVPLVLITRRRDIMGDNVNGKWTTRLAWLISGVIVSLNVLLLCRVFGLPGI